MGLAAYERAVTHTLTATLCSPLFAVSSVFMFLPPLPSADNRDWVLQGAEPIRSPRVSLLRPGLVSDPRPREPEQTVPTGPLLPQTGEGKTGYRVQSHDRLHVQCPPTGNAAS